MFIKVLSLCAALFAPESSGVDPHGRSLHLQTPVGFDISYDVCLTTVRQAQKYNIDPFVAVALMYQTTKMSPEVAKKSKVHHKIQHQYGCDDHDGKFIKSSCSPFMLSNIYLAYLLHEEGQGYKDALCSFLSLNDKCTRKTRRQAKIVENMARRFADVYSRTHTSFIWNNPFLPKPKLEYHDPYPSYEQPRQWEPWEEETMPY